MPDLGNVSLTRCSSLKSFSSLTVKTLVKDTPRDDDEEEEENKNLVEVEVKVDEFFSNGNGNGNGNGNYFGVVPRRNCSGKSNGKGSFEDHVRLWMQRKMELGVPPSRCLLPFLVGAKKMVECLQCHGFIYPGEEVPCSIRNCNGVYHITCAKQRLGVSNLEKFRCQRHACYLCKQRYQWRCLRCSMTSHDKCAAWSEEVVHFPNNPGWVVCWKHPIDWRLDKKSEQHVLPTSDIEEVFCRLPLPYVFEEFKIDFTWEVLKENKLEPPPYTHIRRNIYLVKKKKTDTDCDVGCTNCRSECCGDCVCRVQCISCSKACHCSENCTNRPFRKDKKIKIVKTQLCGWGVVAAEPIEKGDFVVEYIGEVINDALCEQRLWDMKYKREKNFYMCEIGKDLTIDATFKGNTSRFLNHSCDPNCILEKWQADGETRVGVFAARPINIGEPLTYDYRFVQFGPEVKCYCGASNCQGYLGTKKKVEVQELNVCWGAKRKRTSSIACLS